MRAIDSGIRRAAWFLVAALPVLSAGCETAASGVLSDAAAPVDAAGPRDGAAADLASPDAGAPDLAGCAGEHTFTAARAAMLSSCGGFGPMSCHTRAPFEGSLDLTAAQAYAALVGVPASAAPAKLRVRPGDPDASFLYQKLTNTQGPDEGNPMPQGEGIQWRPPDPAALAVLRCWILAGAPND